MSQLQKKQIAIIGGGPGGLALARILQLGDKTEQYSIKVYERDVDANVRIQGGPLDLHEDSGQIFIDKAELRSEFEAVARVEGGIYSLYTQDHEKVWERAVPQHPETDRNDLRMLFVNSLKPNTMEWDKHLIKIEPEGHGYFLHFKNQSPVYCDIIIGGDGANSKVRDYIAPHVQPTYSGVTIIQGNILHPEQQCPDLQHAVNHGNLWALGKGGQLFSMQQKGDGSLIYYITLRVDEDWIEKTHGVDYSTQDQDIFRRAALSICDNYGKVYLDAIKSTDSFVLRKSYGLIYRSTLDTRWNDFGDEKDRPAITLLGDAAHVMPFFGGVGVNNALMDSVELAEEILNGNHPNLLGAFSAYEKRMIDRCISAAQWTERMEDNFHDPDDNVRAITKVFMSFAPMELDERWKYLMD
ncbi:unnamed protein product [Absidia cylindrospora]